MAHDRDVAGVRCSAVLLMLPDYLEDELADADRERIEAHLRGCDWCEHFGGAYAALVTTLRSKLTAGEEPDADARRRLRERLGLA